MKYKFVNIYVENGNTINIPHTAKQIKTTPETDTTGDTIFNISWLEPICEDCGEILNDLDYCICDKCVNASRSRRLKGV